MICLEKNMPELKLLRKKAVDILYYGKFMYIFELILYYCSKFEIKVDSLNSKHFLEQNIYNTQYKTAIIAQKPSPLNIQYF